MRFISEELTIVEKRIPEYCVVLSDSVDGWEKEVGRRRLSEQSCRNSAEWICGLLTAKERERYTVSVAVR